MCNGRLGTPSRVSNLRLRSEPFGGGDTNVAEAGVDMFLVSRIWRIGTATRTCVKRRESATRGVTETHLCRVLRLPQRWGARVLRGCCAWWVVEMRRKQECSPSSSKQAGHLAVKWPARCVHTGEHRSTQASRTALRGRPLGRARAQLPASRKARARQGELLHARVCIESSPRAGFSVWLRNGLPRVSVPVCHISALASRTTDARAAWDAPVY